MDKLIFRIALFGLLLGGISTAAHAESIPTVSILVPEQQVFVGDLVPVPVTVDSQGILMNVADVTLTFDPAVIEVVRVEQKLTNFPLWPESPTVKNGQVHFSAGRPNGLIASGATVATLFVRALQTGTATLQIDSASRLYRNDGLGTPITVSASSATMTVFDTLVPHAIITSTSHPSPSTWYARRNVVVSWEYDVQRQYSIEWSNDSSAEPDDAPDTVTGVATYEKVTDGIWWFSVKSRGSDGIWGAVARRAVLVDATAPEPFTIAQLPGTSTGGDQVISWVATDATSGIVKAEILVHGRLSGAVTSPLLVQRKWRGKDLTVRVTDGAGLIREATWHAPGTSTNIPVLISTAIVVIVAGVGVCMYLRRRRRFGS